VELSGDSARASEALLSQSEAFIATRNHALDELHLKHAYERA
jgi:hypothetical protein